MEPVSRISVEVAVEPNSGEEMVLVTTVIATGDGSYVITAKRFLDADSADAMAAELAHNAKYLRQQRGRA